MFNSTGKYQHRYLWESGRGTPDISQILMFYWFGPVLYLDLDSKFPETTEIPGYFCSVLRGQSQIMLVIYFRLFLELDLVCQTGM
jgi:hypothetical protein